MAESVLDPICRRYRCRNCAFPWLVDQLIHCATGAPYTGGVLLFRLDGEVITTITNPAPEVQNDFGVGMCAAGNDMVLIGAPLSEHGSKYRRYGVSVQC